jgi:hypothetical protein
MWCGVVIGDRGANVDISPKLVLPIILVSAERCALCAEGHLCSEVLPKAICHQGKCFETDNACWSYIPVWFTTHMLYNTKRRIQ